LKEEVKDLPAEPELNKLAELLFNLHQINAPLAAQLADES